MPGISFSKEAIDHMDAATVYLRNIHIVWPWATVAITLAVSYLLLKPKTKDAPSLPETVPFISNTYLYLTDMGSFLEKAIPKLRESHIIKFRLGLKDVYWVAGSHFTSKLFASAPHLNSNLFALLLMDKFWGMPQADLSRFENDTSGCLNTPTPGTEMIHGGERLWAAEHRLYAQYLSHSKYNKHLGQRFLGLLSKRLDAYPRSEWSTIAVFSLLRSTMAESAIASFFGTRILELNADLISCFWEFDSIAGILVWGLPRFLKPQPFQVRDRLHGMMKRYLDSAWDNFDWDGPDADAEWDIHFGARVCRELARWLKEGRFSSQSAVGEAAALMFGIIANSVPLTTWALFEVLKDPSLAQEVRSEASKAYAIDPDTREHHIDIEKLLSSPLLQSIYVETLRLHVSYNVTREATKPFEMGGYEIKKGSLVQSPSALAHREEHVWGADGHPASEFWAHRHVKYVSVVDESGVAVNRAEFAIRGRPNSFFPYGGGIAVCPGRHFAKQEIIVTLAILLVKFDIQFESWINMDGTESHRAAQENRAFSGTVATPPDRDMKVLLRRLW